MTAGFSDRALFSDGAGFGLWRPPLFAIVSQRPMLVFHTVSYAGAYPDHLLFADEDGGFGVGIHLARDRYGVSGHLKADPRSIPIRWTPLHGLEAPDAVDWVRRKFGPASAWRAEIELAERCAREWAGATALRTALPREDDRWRT